MYVKGQEMDEQPITITQVFARAKASILKANDATVDKEQRENMRRIVLDSLELAELRTRNIVNTRNGVAQ
jgi:gamma-glutamyl phosphate reductase